MGKKEAKILRTARTSGGRKAGILSLVTAIGFLIGLYYQSCLTSTFEFRYQIDESSIKKYYYHNTEILNETEVCVIPATPPIPEFFKNNWKPTMQDCSYELRLALLENDTYLRFLPDVPLPCCVQEITRGKTDQESGLTDCNFVEENIDVGMKEALLIKCGRYINAEANIPIKLQVQEKVVFWENVPLEERPMSVLLLGIDSMSRSHAYRSLPQSIESMMKLGFLDFRSYHSIAPSTLTNFMGFLMGQTRNEVRSSCAPNWSTFFDNCPLIWKKYSEQKYVSNYVEDGSQTFNWGGQSGFTERPTDYYLHHLFLQLSKIREDLISFWTKDEPDCASTETIPEFILRYNMRFLQKFAKIPFFSFSWINSPFHDDIYALSSLDSKLVKLFEMISLNKDLLRNTLIIFLSDHGDRTSFFNGNAESPESYIERGLPPLFIRLPDRLKEKHPEIINVVKSNSEKFTTPFDIHETLLHILSLNSNYRSNGIQADRSSLFLEFPRNRTCSSTNIPPANCLCNVQFKPFGNSGGEEGKHLTNQLVNFAIAKLNLKVKESKYYKNCSEWKTDWWNPVIFHRIVSRSDKVVDSVIAFKVSPGDAKFEARIQTLVDKNGLVGENTVVGFSRINRYGDQSWCVGGETDDDKMMKELCYCI